jgi:hypothetical protein
MRIKYHILIVKLERKRSLRRAGCIWEDNIKIDFKEMVRGGKFSWFRTGPIASSCEDGNEALGSKKGGEYLCKASCSETLMEIGLFIIVE